MTTTRLRFSSIKCPPYKYFTTRGNYRLRLDYLLVASCQKDVKNSRVGGSNLSAKKVTKGFFQEFQSRGKWVRHRMLQKVFKNSKAGGSDLSAQKVAESFQEFQSRGKWLRHRMLQKIFRNFKVGGSDLSTQKVTECFLKVGGSDLSAQKVTEGFQEFRSRGRRKWLKCTEGHRRFSRISK